MKESEMTHLFPLIPRQREKTIASAPSLIVLVLNPFPSSLFLFYKIKDLYQTSSNAKCRAKTKKSNLRQAYIDQRYSPYCVFLNTPKKDIL